MKRLLRRTNVEDALKRLDLLTREKDLTTAARNATGMKEVTRDAHDDFRATKHLRRHIDRNVRTVQKDMPSVNDSAKYRAQRSSDPYFY
jgi:hypothetical protein